MQTKRPSTASWHHMISNKIKHKNRELSSLPFKINSSLFSYIRSLRNSFVLFVVPFGRVFLSFVSPIEDNQGEYRFWHNAKFIFFSWFFFLRLNLCNFRTSQFPIQCNVLCAIYWSGLLCAFIIGIWSSLHKTWRNELKDPVEQQATITMCCQERLVTILYCFIAFRLLHSDNAILLNCCTCIDRWEGFKWITMVNWLGIELHNYNFFFSFHSFYTVKSFVIKLIRSLWTRPSIVQLWCRESYCSTAILS